MKISVQVKTNAKQEFLERLPDGTFVARVRVPPIEGRANERIREILAEFFDCPKSHIRLVAGEKSKKKVFEVPG